MVFLSYRLKGDVTLKKLWERIDAKELAQEWKVRLFLLFNCIRYAVLGLLVWLIVSRFALSTIEWAVCFVGYPGVFIGYVGGLIFLCSKE